MNWTLKPKNPILSWFGSRPAPIEPSKDEIEKIISQAETFDRLLLSDGWKAVLDHIHNHINSEIVRATECPTEPERQRTYVVRWDAKRALLDDLLGYIKSIQESRDEIAAQIQREREEKEPWQTAL